MPTVEIVSPENGSLLPPGRVEVVVRDYFTNLGVQETALFRAGGWLLITPAYASEPYGSLLDVRLDEAHLTYTPALEFSIDVEESGWHIVSVELLRGNGEVLDPPITDSAAFRIE